MQAAVSNLEHYTSPAEHCHLAPDETRIREIRKMWSWGRISKLQGKETRAAVYFEACEKLCKGWEAQPINSCTASDPPESDMLGDGELGRGDNASAMEDSSGESCLTICCHETHRTILFCSVPSREVLRSLSTEYGCKA